MYNAIRKKYANHSLHAATKAREKQVRVLLSVHRIGSTRQPLSRASDSVESGDGYEGFTADHKLHPSTGGLAVLAVGPLGVLQWASKRVP